MIAIYSTVRDNLAKNQVSAVFHSCAEVCHQKCVTQTYSALYGDAMFVCQRGTNMAVVT